MIHEQEWVSDPKTKRKKGACCLAWGGKFDLPCSRSGAVLSEFIPSGKVTYAKAVRRSIMESRCRYRMWVGIYS